MPSRFTDGSVQLGPVQPGQEADLRLLATLHVLFETRSVTRAAQQLGVSQPSVSRSLARARKQFGDPLLLRSGAGMVLTARAEALRQPLGTWLADGRALLRPSDVVPERMQRAFRIASTDYGVLSVIHPSLQRIARTAPGVELVISPLTLDSPRDMARGDLDLVITGLTPDLSAVHVEHLFEEHHLCLAARDHPALVDGRMSIKDFLAYPHVVMRVAGGVVGLSGHEHHQSRRRILIQTDNFMMAPYLVAGSEAVMTTPSRAAQQFAQAHDLALFEPPVALPPFGYWLTWHERSRRDPEIRWLIDELAAPFRAEDLARGGDRS